MRRSGKEGIYVRTPALRAPARRDPRRHPRLGAQGGPRGGAARRGGPRARVRGARRLERRAGVAARRRLLDRARRPAPARPVHALSGQRAARPVPPRRPGAVDVDGSALEGRPPARPRAARAARRHVHPRGHVRRRDRAARASARHRHHGDRADADRRLPRRARLGLRRRLPMVRAGSVWRARRAPAARRRGARTRHRGGARHRPQPRRRVRGEGAARVRPVLHRALHDALGRGDQLRRRGLGRGARVADPGVRVLGPRCARRQYVADTQFLSVG